MNTETISDLFVDGGLIIRRTADESIFDINYDEVVALFEKYGVLLFRGYEVDGSTVTQFTDIYTEQYSADALRRHIRFDNKKIRNVDSGRSEVVLHSEASLAPSFPEIVWLFCNTPAIDQGESTLCDGVKLWDTLSSETKGVFLSEQIQYELKIPVMEKKDKRIKRSWLLSVIGAGNGYIDYQDGCLYILQKRYAVQETRVGNTYAFANHLLVSLDSEPQLISRKLSDGNEIPDHIQDEIKTKANQLTYDHIWQKNDLLMVDNKRFMHGRKSLVEGDPRDVVVIQSQRASFGYGFTTRKKLSEVPTP